MQRSLVEQVGPFAPYIICHDWDYALRCLLVENLVFINKPLYEYRVHQTNTMRQVPEDVRWGEIDQVIANYLRGAQAASNPQAPCQKNFPDDWERFLAEEMPHLILLPMILACIPELDFQKYASPNMRGRFRHFLKFLPWKFSG
jgi:hypothetical protein